MDFKQPVGMHLKEDNRWVKKAQIILWNEIEKRYAALFTNRKGNVAKPLRLALGARIIQVEYGYTDEEIGLQIQENPYLQYFCGYEGYDDEHLPFDPSLMVYIRKRLTSEVLGEINEMIIRDAKAAEKKKDDDDKDKDGDNKDDTNDTNDTHGDGSANSGTLTIDSTCAPSNIRYPQDVSLLNEARENAEKLLDELHDPADGKKPRNYRKRAARRLTAPRFPPASIFLRSATDAVVVQHRPVLSDAVLTPSVTVKDQPFMLSSLRYCVAQGAHRQFAVYVFADLIAYYFSKLAL